MLSLTYCKSYQALTYDSPEEGVVTESIIMTYVIKLCELM